jgi:hypothetical protein
MCLVQGDGHPNMTTITVTDSQLMALIDIVAAELVPPPGHTVRVYIDVVNQVETHPSELLTLLMDARMPGERSE